MSKVKIVSLFCIVLLFSFSLNQDTERTRTQERRKSIPSIVKDLINCLLSKYQIDLEDAEVMNDLINNYSNEKMQAVRQIFKKLGPKVQICASEAIKTKEKSERDFTSRKDLMNADYERRYDWVTLSQCLAENQRREMEEANQNIVQALIKLIRKKEYSLAIQQYTFLVNNKSEVAEICRLRRIN